MSTSSNDTTKPNTPTFLIGPPAKRSLRRLLQSATDPAQAIKDFQNSNSLHSQFAKAFGTTPTHELPSTTTTNTRKRAKLLDAENNEKKIIAECFQPQSVLQFLHHIGDVTQTDVHKKIADTLLKSLEVEIGRTNDNESLLKLLRNCWTPCNTIDELRPVVIAVIKKLGDDTPDAVLQRLAERDKNGELLYNELMNSFDIKIRRLIWESDYVRFLKECEENDSLNLLKDGNTTLLDELLQPEFEKYINDKSLKCNASTLFTTTVSERRIITQNRRTMDKAEQLETKPSAEAISKIHEIIGNRPKLLTAFIFKIVYYYTEKAANETFLGGSSSGLICTLLSDVILSYRQLPRSFEHLTILATILDRSVKGGVLQDDIIAQIQGCLRVIFFNSTATNNDKNTSTEVSNITTAFSSSSKKRYSPDLDQEFIQKLLQKVISAGLTAMKTTDPQCLFLNPVTDSIAPGYSRIVTKPMCIKTMFDKLPQYKSLQEYEKDVQLMFQNCITYNIGKDGQWFRGEAKRQNKIWKENVYPQAKELYRKEVAKRKKVWEKANLEEEKQVKKVTLSEAIKNMEPVGKRIGVDKEAVLHLTLKDIMPLEPTPKPPSTKKRKKDGDTILPTTYSLLPTLACMVLSDPFVIRLILDKILIFIRGDILPSKSLPYSHTILPSLLQLLYLIQNTWGYCHTLNKRFYIPSCGIETEEALDKRPFVFLRSMIPLLSKLVLDVKLDERFTLGGDLYDITTINTTLRHSISSIHDWKEYVPILSSNQVVIIRALLQTIFISLLPPGTTSSDITLVKQMNRCMDLLLLFCTSTEENETSKNVVILEPSFWKSFNKVILKYKSKLSSGVRDWCIELYMKCLGKKDYCGRNRLDLLQSFILLLTEWCAYGNQIMPFDLLFTTCENAIDTTYSDFQKVWLEAKDEFKPIQDQFLKLLKNVPDSYANPWKVKMGIDEDSLEKMRDGGGGDEGNEDVEVGDGVEDSNDAEVVDTMEEDDMEEN